MKPELYTVHARDGLEFLVHKFDQDFNRRHTYRVVVTPGQHVTCDGEWCMNRSTCRHRTLVDIFVQARRLNATGQFFEYDQRRWVDGPKGDV